MEPLCINALSPLVDACNPVPPDNVSRLNMRSSEDMNGEFSASSTCVSFRQRSIYRTNIADGAGAVVKVNTVKVGGPEILPADRHIVLFIARSQAMPLLLPFLLLFGFITVILAVPVFSTATAHYLVAYGSFYTFTILWLYFQSVFQMHRLLRSLGEQVPRVLASTPDTTWSVDVRVRYIQLCAWNAMKQPVLEEPTMRDPLAFMEDMISEKEQDQNVGSCITDPHGTIMWCNETLSKAFKYPPGALVGENIRTLMPPPYSKQHDAIMRKYDRSARGSHIVGFHRRVPVIDREGRTFTALLGVTEHADPADGDNFVFLGTLDCISLGDQPDPAATIQEAIDRGEDDIVKCCVGLESHSENLIVADANGIIMWTNDAATLMLHYGFGELVGKSVNILMEDAHASQHDALMAGYIGRAEAAAKAGSRCESRVVGKSRDLYAKAKSGILVRIFMTVMRVDRRSRRPQDSVFVASMVVVQQSPEITQDSESPTVASSRKNSTVIAGPRALKTIALSPLCPRKVTVVAIQLSGMQWFQKDPKEPTPQLYQSFLNILMVLCHRFKAVAQQPLGDLIYVTFNHALASSSHRNNAGGFLTHLFTFWAQNSPPSGSRFHAVGCSGEALTGQFQKCGVLLTQLHDRCAILLRAAEECNGTHPLIDATLYDELQYAYDCRMVNLVTILEAQQDAETRPIYELRALKELEDDEWMYQYQVTQQRRLERWAYWKDCWQALGSGGGAPADYVVALAALGQHTRQDPEDEVGHWLLAAVVARQGARGSPAVETAGRISFILHYRTGDRLGTKRLPSRLVSVVSVG